MPSSSDAAVHFPAAAGGRQFRPPVGNRCEQHHPAPGLRMRPTAPSPILDIISRGSEPSVLPYELQRLWSGQRRREQTWNSQTSSNDRRRSLPSRGPVTSIDYPSSTRNPWTSANEN